MPADAVVETRRQDTPAGRQRIDSACLDIPTSVVLKGSGGVWRGMCWAGNTWRSGGMSIAS